MRSSTCPLRPTIRHVLAAAGTVTCALLPAVAQGQSDGSELGDGPVKVLVTGSHIPTIERETALPMQVITREQIEQANFQTAAQVVNAISAAMSFGAFNEAQGLGNIVQPGFASAGLRGLGQQATLVLLNGRRIANFAFTTLGADLNAIPLAAVDRVEVVKNGASAIYGSDAVAGVINFVLRSNYRGVEVYAQYALPEASGGHSKQLTATAGYGDLALDRFNAWGMVDYSAFGGVEARNRSFAARRYIPEEALDRTTLNAYPANVSTPAGVRNPTGDSANGYRDPSCAPSLSFPIPGPATQFQCRWQGDGAYTIVDPSERLSLAGGFTWQIDREHQLFVNGTYSRNTFRFVALPTQVSRQTSFQAANGFLLPPGSAYYPHEFARAFGIDGAPLDLYWSAVDLGAQVIEPTSTQWSIVAGVRGTLQGWAYDGAFNYSRNDADQRAAGGYLRESALFPILNSGVVDPFGRNTPAVVNLLSTAAFEGVLRTGRSTTTSFDFTATKDVYALAAGPLSLAVGVSARREALEGISAASLAAGDILNLPATPSLSGSRNNWAVYAEANVPIVQSLEAGFALRYDHYDDFGGTTNPQVSLRWQPANTFLMRASAGTGYFAPALAGVYQPPVYGFTAGNLSDPARCPTTQSAQDCNRQFPTLGGGNPALKPTTSSQWSVGAVWSPTRDLAIGADFVSILLDDRINIFLAQQILAQCPDGVTGPLCHLIQRGPVDPAYPTLPGPIVRIDQFRTNLGKQKATAVDVEARLAVPTQGRGRFGFNFTGTYNIENLRQQIDGSYVDQVGAYTITGGLPGVIPRWRHDLTLDWALGPWSVAINEVFQTGGNDQAPGPGTGTSPRVIDDYDIWNVRVAYAGFRHWTLSGGIKNLLDRDPPFSNQTQSFQVGYDPSYTDPRGRLYWMAVRYAFR